MRMGAEVYSGTVPREPAIGRFRIIPVSAAPRDLQRVCPSADFVDARMSRSEKEDSIR